MPVVASRRLKRPSTVNLPALFRERAIEYAKFLNGKRVIVVGPAAYLKGQGLGKWIDSFDVVVKLNWGETLAPEDYGRTDVLYKRLLKLGKADEILVDEYVAAGVQWVIAVASPTRNADMEYLHATLGDRVKWFPDNSTRQILARELGNSPLLGPVAVRHLLAYGVESVTVTGCDFYMTGYAPEYGGKVYREYMHRREGEIGPTHNGPHQLRWLADLQKRDRRLHFDDVLADLANRPGDVDPRLLMGVTAIIPARYESSRFPGKPLALIAGKPMILHVCERVRMAGIGVLVATDDERIAAVVREAGFRATITGPALTGTDRVAAALPKRPKPREIIVNVQGDEPLIDVRAIVSVIEAKRKYPKAIINAMAPLQDGDAENPNVVKAVVRQKDLVYLSRAAVPTKWRQLGLYAFSPAELQAYAAAGKRLPLEAAEDVEILRFVDMGMQVKMVPTDAASKAVDRPDDIEIVEGLLNA